ncbi:MT-A70-domain-containing protein [Dichotomopilus funicola]|uniref:MT-A70-domain-containing protein n=1 Tax=Dichotomopilus funicola TaxID=1934379 RepID=A0AAN6V8K2_9PEZI|nr:MT-A70-domain-containing protein [Dichotomopilus funicola]
MADESPPLSSSILWQNDNKSVVLLDLPRSIEEAQVLPSQLTAISRLPTASAKDNPDLDNPDLDNPGRQRKLRRLISAPPPTCPFPTPEPKAGRFSEPPVASPSAQVAELMTQATVESALDEIKQSSYSGPWCLPRVYAKNPPTPSSVVPDDPPTKEKETSYHLPENAHALPGTITSQRTTFLKTTRPNQFHLILLDPPWPNRSAKRKRAYRTAPFSSSSPLSSLPSSHLHTPPSSPTPAEESSPIEISTLLHQIPIASRLAPGGLVAVWVTNAARTAELLTQGGHGGVFAAWGVEVVGEWIWLKVTAGGEPVVGVDSEWRKPWERLIIARRKGEVTGSSSGVAGDGPVPGKVIVSVPDVHSRKPNLRGLFEELLPERYEALEVFARNLTAGWWAWGDEALLFQRRECWEDEEGGE